MTTLLEMITSDEGRRLYVYDDATGKPIEPGSHVIGHPTIGVGRALDVHGISSDECDALVLSDIHTCQTTLAYYPWYSALDKVRQDCVTAMAFQMGVLGVLRFTDMIHALINHDFDGASSSMLDSYWAKVQSPARAVRMAKMMKTGAYQT